MHDDVLGARRGRCSPRLIQLTPQLGCHAADQDASKARACRQDNETVTTGETVVGRRW